MEPHREDPPIVWNGLDDLRPHLAPIATLRPDPKNAKTHGARNLDAIAESYRAFGQQKPIIIATDRVVVAGNGQLAAAHRLGWTHIARVVTNLSPAAIRAFALADNRTAELAEWDDALLAETLAFLQAADPALALATGFSPDEIAGFLVATEGCDAEEAAPPELPSGDKAPFRGMTFTLTNAQADTVAAAIARAADEGAATPGAAVVTIARAYLGKR